MTTMEKPKTARARKVAPASERTAKVAPKAEPEMDLTSYDEREPSAVNKAEIAFFIETGALTGVHNVADLELAQKVAQLVAGTAHRHFQGSKAAARVHGK